MKLIFNKFLNEMNPLLVIVPILYSWKNQKTFGFLVFLGGKIENIGQKRVK